MTKKEFLKKIKSSETLEWWLLCIAGDFYASVDMIVEQLDYEDAFDDLFNHAGDYNDLRKYIGRYI